MSILFDWEHRFPGCEPIGHHLRETFKERWVRFHSLPESERYPADETDFQELLRRHNQVLDVMTQPNSSLVLLSTGHSFALTPNREYPQLIELDPSAIHWSSRLMSEDDGFIGPTYWHFYVSNYTWKWGLFNPIIRLVADCSIADVLIVESDCRWVVHPYDGGMDVICETRESRNDLRGRFSSWLSSRHDGM